MGQTMSAEYAAFSESNSNTRPLARSAADPFDYKINTSHVNPVTGSVLPQVNPLARVPRQTRSGQIQQVLFNQSFDPRGDADHLVGASQPTTNANPRAWGALGDRQRLATVYDRDRHVPIPVR
jgi:hypothetical protein